MLLQNTRKVVVLIPSRNEADSIGSTIQTVKDQTYKTDEIIVVANNCTDNTAEVAKKCGVSVMEMPDNKHMKAGALNYALEKIVPDLDDDDCILIMDADTSLTNDLIEKCLVVLDEDPIAGAVGSIFTGRTSSSLLGRLQLMEFWRYRRQIHRNGDKAFVLSGTASLFLVGTLRAVKARRQDGSLPFSSGSYYDVLGRTEDNEITLAILKLGYKCPTANAFSVTDVMESPIKLINQRERWYNGALVNLKAYGTDLPWFMKWVYWKQQLGLLISLLAFFALMTLIVVSFAIVGGITVTWFWLLPILLLAIERTKTVWSLGWKARFIAALVIPEQIYNMLLLLVFGLALKNFAFSRQGQWHST